MEEVKKLKQPEVRRKKSSPVGFFYQKKTTT